MTDDTTKPLGHLIMAEDSEADPAPLFFKVSIPDLEQATLAVAKLVPDQICVPIRPLKDAEIEGMRLGEVKRL